jgi:hypothetical protein
LTKIEGADPLAASGFRLSRFLRAALTAGVAVLFVSSFSGVADAQFQVRGTAKPIYKAKSKKDVPVKRPFGENMPKGVLQLVVSVADQRATLYSNGQKIAQSPVSTGTPSHPTPFGIFSVIQKNRWHRSNLYGNAPMWYMHRLTWSGIALHEGHLPGRPASHGCIRLPQDFVSRLWAVSKLGVRVVVSPREITFSEFSHAKLFNPKQKPADDAPSVSAPVYRLRSTLDTTGPDHTQGQGLVIATQASADASTEPAMQDTELSSAARAPASTPATDATATGKPIPPVETVQPAMGVAPSAAATSADPDKPAIDPAELILPRPAPLRSRAGEPPRVSGQVAVFISRKEKRIFVRQGFIPLFDMPVEIADIDRPLGTHLYTAMQVQDEGTRMRWNVLTMAFNVPPGTPLPSRAKAKAPPPKKNAKDVSKAMPKAPVVKPASNATEALDRVTIPQEAIDRISELVIPGSSLIISDEGLGRETGRYTEFIVVTR